MKLTLFGLLLLITSASASAETACLAIREVIPYSFHDELETHCNGKRLAVSSLFGKDLEKKFKAHIKNFGYKKIAKIDKHLIISKQTKQEIGVSELCFVVKDETMEEFSFTCETSMGWSIQSTKEADLRYYLKNHNFKILNTSKRNTDPYVVGR